MSRKPRLHYPGACYHVILRGNAGHDVFFDTQDRNRFFFLLREGIEKYDHRIHGYCLMTNHLHLVIQVGDVSLSRIMQNVSFRYTSYVNHRLKQAGHLFQGRYKALLIDADSYLLQIIRYVHNNPVRAEMVIKPEDYPWSSHNVYLGNSSVPWLTTDWVLSQFSTKKNQAIELYRKYVLAGQNEAQRKEFYRGNVEGQVLGEDHFVERVFAKVSQKISGSPTLEQVLQAVCKQYGIDEDDLSSGSRQKRISEPRSVAAMIVRDISHLSLTDLSRKIERDLSGLSQAAGRLDKKMNSDKRLSKKVDKIMENIW